jgi:hypothetical protein
MVHHHSGSLSEVGFNAYITFSAIKRHFTTPTYDFFKYSGKVNSSFDSFCARKDAYTFQRLGKKERDVKGLVLANAVAKPKLWVGELLEDPAQTTYQAWKKKQDALTDHVKNSLSFLDPEYKVNFLSTNGHYPLIVDKYLQQQISLETLTVLAALSNSESYWSEVVKDTVVFPGILLKIRKYRPFLIYSNDKMVAAVKDHFF